MTHQVSFLEVCSILPNGENGAVPEWLMLLPAGVSRGVDGRGPYNLDRPAAVVAASMESGRPLAFDYNHQTVFASLQGQESPASGWIDQLDVRDGAIWGHIDWTERGRLAVASKEYRYVSPAFKHDKAGRVERLVSAGLVNAPNLTELPAINAQLRAISAHHVQPGDSSPMDKLLQARLAAALGLASDVSVDAIVTHAEANRTLATGAPDPSLYVPMAAFTELQTQVGTLRESASVAHASSLVNAASKAGKLTPAMRDWGLSYASQNPDGFGQWVAAAPVIVAGGIDPAVAAAAAEAGKIETGALTPAELAVCAQLAITPADYTASKQKAA
jgi:phage I-like protein